MAGLTQEQFMQLMGNKQEPVTSSIASVLNLIKKPLDYYALNKNIPLVGGQSIADLTGLTGTQSLVQDFSQGKPMMQEGLPDPRFMDVAGMLPMVKPAAIGAGQAAKYIGKEALRQGYEGTGLLGKLAPDVKAYAYLPDTPSKPNSEVGTRFTREDLNNLVPKNKIKIEDLEGSTIKIMPWDSTNAEQRITSVSGVPVNTRTYGGQDFARAKHNYEADIGGTSNKEIAKRIAGRIEEAKKANLEYGGTGDVYMLPSTMSKGSENFSPMPTDIFTQLIQNNPDPKAIAQLNEWLRTAPVATKKGQVRPFGEFKGIDTPEGLAQLYSGEGFKANGTAGEFRKAFAKEMGKLRNEQAFGYNAKDVTSAVTDPSLIGVPKGYIGNTIIKASDETKLLPSTHPAYDTDFSGKYAGSLLHSVPVDVLMPKSYGSLYQEFALKYPNMHPDAIKNMAIAAMEKRKAGVYETVNKDTINNYYKYMESLNK